MVAFTQPVSFGEAIQFALGKRILPTSLDSNGIRELSREVREKSLFSARTTHEGYLGEIQQKIDGLLKGEFNEATARAELQDALDQIGYDPDLGGFPSPGGEGGRRPDEGGPQTPERSPMSPSQRGSLKDLSSDKRIRLVLDTNLAQAQNYGFKLQGQDPDSLWQYPAYELIREEVREVPRGEMPGTAGWDERFVRAGGTLVDGRMIALKSDPIWENLGNSELFSDGIDASYPPYAFNSGMGWREVPRAECIELGLIRPGEMPEAAEDQTFFTPEDQENADQFSPDQLRRALAELGR